MNAETAEPITGIERPVRLGIAVCVVTFGVFGLWSAFAPIDGAAHAPGVVAVKSYKKVVQHLEGGIVSEINVRNGDRVSVGDPLIVLDGTQSLAQLGVVRTQFVALKALEARLIAEREQYTEVTYPELLSSTGEKITEEITTQNSIFSSRRNTHEGSLDVLGQRISQLEAKLEGLVALQESKNRLAASFEEELVDTRSLLTEGFSDKTRLRELERNYARYVGEASDLTASIASAKIEIGEAQLQILQQQNEFHNEVVTQLGETQTQLRDISERINAIEDIVNRTVVRSPEIGVVTSMQFHTIGAVIEPGTAIAEIVPLQDDLVIEAKVSPLDVDRVSEGQVATIRFSTFSMGTIPTMHGIVTSLSADSIVDSGTGSAFYLARIEVSAQSLDDLGDLTLMPGMPAEVFYCHRITYFPAVFVQAVV